MKAVAPQALAHCPLLVVDDAPTNRAIIGAQLRHAGFDDVRFAADGAEALQQVQQHKPDLVLLDILMPVMAGYETCRRLRADARWADLPVLAMTGLEEADDRARVFAVGATDLILKPIHPPELIARTTIHLQGRRLIQGLREHAERAGRELAAARRMQESLLPDAAALAALERSYGVSLAAHFAPSEELGGDLWGAWPVDATRFGLFTLDVAGHGTIAAINAFRIHTLLWQDAAARGDPARLLTRLNRRMQGLLAVGQFATLFYAVFDIAADRVTYAAAGAPGPLLLQGGRQEELDGSGLPLGIQAGARYANRRAAWRPGAGLALYSDAFSEARDGGGALLGDARAQACCAAALAEADAGAAIARLRQAALAQQIDDDLTLVCLKR